MLYLYALIGSAVAVFGAYLMNLTEAVHLPLEIIGFFVAVVLIEKQRPEQHSKDFRQFKKHEKRARMCTLFVFLAVCSYFNMNYGSMGEVAFENYYLSKAYLVFVGLALWLSPSSNTARIWLYSLTAFIASWFSAVVTTEVGEKAILKQGGGMERMRHWLFDHPHVLGKTELSIHQFHFDNGFMTLLTVCLMAMVLTLIVKLWPKKVKEEVTISAPQKVEPVKKPVVTERKAEPTSAEVIAKCEARLVEVEKAIRVLNDSIRYNTGDTSAAENRRSELRDERKKLTAQIARAQKA